MEIDKVPINSIVRFNNVMPNYSPNTQGLKENRGVKPSLNKKEYSIKLSPEKKADLEKIAQEFGFKHGGKGSLSALLEAIADDELMLVQTPPSRRRSPGQDNNTDNDGEQYGDELHKKRKRNYLKDN